MNPQQSLESIVRDTFALIIERYGYEVVEATDCNVRLDAACASVIVRYDCRRSFEVGIDFSELESGVMKRRIPFSIGEVFREFSVPNAKKLDFMQSSDLSLVRKFLATAAENLDRYCSSILRGDSAAFASVNNRRSRESLAYTQQVQIQAIRKRADSAWREKRYQEFAELLGQFYTSLSKAEQKKVDYAMKASTG